MLATFLNIDPSTIKIVGLRRGSVVADMVLVQNQDIGDPTANST